jgi:hypothetical protein
MIRVLQVFSSAAIPVLATMLLPGPVRAAAPAPTPEQFDKIQAMIKPAAGEEKWQQIPWMASLWQARIKAAAAGKPILLWEMDGHPLGCV